MKKSRLKPEFDPKYLDKLAKEEGSCVHVLRSTHHLALHPYHLNDLNLSIKELLNKGVAKYNAELDGILFGYNNIKFISQLGQIVEDSCYIHVDIEADFYVFKPVIGQTLQGVVKKKSKDHIGCLVHEIFNVSVPKKKKSGDEWVGSSIALNSEVLITVTDTDFGGRLPYIKGKIESVLSEPEVDYQSTTLIEHEVSGEEEKVKKKKKKRLRFEDTEVPEAEEETEPPKKKRKKSKKSDTSTEDL